MTKRFKVNFRDIKTMEFDEGTSYKDIADCFKEYFSFDSAPGNWNIFMAYIDKLVGDSL